jgi:long-subunit acyl-CoA synthetase (AMP-forming)
LRNRFIIIIIFFIRLQPTLLHIVPTLAQLFIKHPALKMENFERVHTLFSSAAPLGAQTANNLLGKFNKPDLLVQEGYGLTEMSPGAMQTPLNNDHLGSCGRLISRTKAKIVDLESGKTLGPNQQGELYMTGPQVMKGYWNNPQATKEMIGEDGWLRSGDVAYYDKGGNFYIVDRLKELIKVKGFQVNF